MTGMRTERTSRRGPDGERLAYGHPPKRLHDISALTPADDPYAQHQAQGPT